MFVSMTYSLPQIIEGNIATIGSYKKVLKLFTFSKVKPAIEAMRVDHKVHNLPCCIF